MTTRTSSESGAGCSIGLLTLTGVMLLIAGGILAYPLIRDALLPPPASFGEAQPLLRPTVTPLPSAGQTAIAATPALLPEMPLLAPGRSLPPVSAASSVLTDPSVQLPDRIVIPAINLNAPIEPVGWSLVNGVSTWDIPDHFTAGWLKTSAPMGRPGNTVLSPRQSAHPARCRPRAAAMTAPRHSVCS